MKKLLAAFVLIAGSSFSALAQTAGPWIEAGARGGRFQSPAHESLNQYEVYAIRTLRWRWTTSSGWSFQTGIEVSAGEFRGAGISTAIGAAGPIVRIRHRDARWHIDIGSRPTLIGHHDFGTKQFGGPFQFTSHGAFDIDVGAHMTIGYRFHHMSNARLYTENEGTNMQSIEVGWKF
jgi:hypothetical protein